MAIFTFSSLALTYSLGCAVMIGTLQPSPTAGPTAKGDPVPVRTVKGELTNLKVVAADAEDLGKLPVGTKTGRRLVLVNSGDTKLDLEVVSTTCGCTSAKFSKASLEPRETTELDISVTVNPSSAPQQQAVTFSIKSNGQLEPQRGVALVKYHADWVVEITPKVLTLTVVKGEEKSVPIAVRQKEPFVFPIESFASSLEGVRFGAPENAKAEALYGTIKTVQMHIPGREKGVGLFWAAPTSESDDAPRPITMSVRTLLPLRAMPGGVIMHVGTTEGTTHKIKFVSRRVVAPVVASMTVHPTLAGFTARVSHADSGGVSVDLSVLPSATSSPWGGEVRLLDADGGLLGTLPVAIVKPSYQ